MMKRDLSSFVPRNRRMILYTQSSPTRPPRERPPARPPRNTLQPTVGLASIACHDPCRTLRLRYASAQGSRLANRAHVSNLPPSRFSTYFNACLPPKRAWSDLTTSRIESNIYQRPTSSPRTGDMSDPRLRNHGAQCQICISLAAA